MLSKSKLKSSSPTNFAGSTAHLVLHWCSQFQEVTQNITLLYSTYYCVAIVVVFQQSVVLWFLVGLLLYPQPQPSWYDVIPHGPIPWSKPAQRQGVDGDVVEHIFRRLDRDLAHSDWWWTILRMWCTCWFGIGDTAFAAPIQHVFCK